MRPVKSLTVLYDGDCGLCAWAKDWILKQPSLVRLEFVAMGSNEAQAAYPQLPPGELAVVADTGEVWLGNRAWLVCLWGLREYRSLACRLTSPGLLRLAREAFSAVSRNRVALSRLLELRGERELERRLMKEAAPQCQNR
jgi:predicted DCC family thiol-disulfide oxidoreductase YuxK